MGSHPRSLWISAAGKLDESDKSLLLTFDQNNDDINDQSTLDVIDSLTHTTNEAYEICVRKRWQIKLPGKKDKIVVRDLLSKITHWIEVFKNVGDQAVSFDPGHSALPWAGARFLIQIATNDFKQFDFVVEGAAKITRITARYRLVECLYLQRSSPATTLLEQAVTSLYTTILNYLVQAKRYFQQRTGIRILKSGVLVQDDFQDLLAKIDADECEADHCADLVETEMANETADQIASLSLEMGNIGLLRDALGRMEQPISQTARRLEQVEDYLNNMQRRDILDWLSSQPYHDHHTDIQAKVLEGTCQWVVQHPEFSKWQNDSKNTLLWLHGTQGSGKSCLTSTVIDEIMKASESNNMHTLAYFYCSRDTAEPQRAKPQSILACIARQLSRQSRTELIAPPTLALYNKLHFIDGSRRAPSIIELCGLIRELTELYDRSMIVVDALDECDSDTRWELVEALESITESASLVKVFVSSREEGDLRLSLQTHGGLQVTSLENEGDIRKFVEFETDRLVAKKQLLAYIRKKQTKEELTKLIKEDVISKANGMFRWAELQLQSLRGIRAEKDIRSELSRIPRDLSALYQDLYDKALETTQETDQIVFQHTLKWMLSAKRTLTHHDFFLAITAFTDLGADDLDEEFILDLLSNFVVSSTTEGDGLFRFAHLSVREFLEQMPEYSIDWTNTFAAEVTLLTLICATDSPSGNEFINKLGVAPLDIVPFSEIKSNDEGIHDYALEFWGEHCLLAGEQNRSAENLNVRNLLHFVLLDDSDDNCPLNWWALSLRSQYAEMAKIMKNYQSPQDRAFLLACAFGLDEIVRVTLEHTLDDRVQEQGAVLAFRKGHDSTAKLLIGPQGDSKLREYVLYHLGDARRWINHDPGLVRWLLDMIEPVQITEKVILNTKHLDAEIICMLLDHNKDLRITKEMVRKCTGSQGAIAAFMTREPNLEISSDILITFMKSYPFDAELCIKLINRIDTAAINCETISWAAHHAGEPDQEEQFMPILRLLLERAGQIVFGEIALLRAFQNDSTGKVVRILLEHGWPVTSRVLNGTAEWGTLPAFSLILDASGGSGQITLELLESAAGNWEPNGEEILKYLVSQLSHPVSDETWVKLIGNCQRRETLRFVLDMKPNVRVPESALLRMAKNTHTNTAEIWAMLLHEERDLEITDIVVGVALESMEYGAHVPQLLDRHGTELVTKRILIGAIRNNSFGDEMTRALMQRNVPIEVPSAEVINQTIKNTHSGLQILQMLEARFGLFEFTDDNLETAASGSLQMIKIVFGRRSITHATPSMLLKAASRGTLDGMKILLQLDGTVVTREIMIAAAGNKQCGAEMVRLLWDHNSEIEPCVEMFLEAADVTAFDLTTIGFLVDRVDDVHFGQQVLEAAITSKNIKRIGIHRLVEMLLESSLQVQLTREMVARIRAHRRLNPFLWRVVARHVRVMEMEETTDISDGLEI